MQLNIIRHAQSVNNALYAREGPIFDRLTDPGLTDLGRSQALALARYLDGEPGREAAHVEISSERDALRFSHLYCSLMRRSIETGLVLAESLDLPLVAWPDLHEEGGMYDIEPESRERIPVPGPNRADLERRYPSLELPAALDDQGWWNRPFETHDQVIARARRFWSELFARHGRSRDRIAVVSHGGFHTSLLSVLVNSPGSVGPIGQPRDVIFALGNTAMTRVDATESGIALIYVNRFDHLKPGQITW